MPYIAEAVTLGRNHQQSLPVCTYPEVSVLVAAHGIHLELVEVHLAVAGQVFPAASRAEVEYPDPRVGPEEEEIRAHLQEAAHPGTVAPVRQA